MLRRPSPVNRRVGRFFPRQKAVTIRRSHLAHHHPFSELDGMARQSSARSSRRNTPQPANDISDETTFHDAPKRALRTTRNQSRDTSDSDGGAIVKGGRRGTRQSSSEGGSGGASQGVANGRRGWPSKKPSALQGEEAHAQWFATLPPA